MLFSQVNYVVNISQLYIDVVLLYTSLSMFQPLSNVSLPSFLSLSPQSSAFVSLLVMRKCLQRLWDWSFISKDQFHHAAPCTTNTHRPKHTHARSNWLHQQRPASSCCEVHIHKHVHTQTGFISKDQSHHIASYARTHTENRSRGREGLKEEDKRESNNSAEAVQVVGR